MENNELDLLLEQVQSYDPAEFSRCRVHDGGIIHPTYGMPFAMEIFPQQAYLLSRLEDSQRRALTVAEADALAGLIPALVQIAQNGEAQLTVRAQQSLYDLVR